MPRYLSHYFCWHFWKSRKHSLQRTINAAKKYCWKVLLLQLNESCEAEDDLCEITPGFSERNSAHPKVSYMVNKEPFLSSHDFWSLYALSFIVPKKTSNIRVLGRRRVLSRGASTASWVLLLRQGMNDNMAYIILNYPIILTSSLDNLINQVASRFHSLMIISFPSSTNPSRVRRCGMLGALVGKVKPSQDQIMIRWYSVFGYTSRAIMSACLILCVCVSLSVCLSVCLFACLSLFSL